MGQPSGQTRLGSSHRAMGRQAPPAGMRALHAFLLTFSVFELGSHISQVGLELSIHTQRMTVNFVGRRGRSMWAICVWSQRLASSFLFCLSPSRF